MFPLEHRKSTWSHLWEHLFPGLMLTAQLRPVATSISWVRLTAKNEVGIGGINSEKLCGDVRLSQVYDKDIGCDTGDRVGRS